MNFRFELQSYKYYFQMLMVKGKNYKITNRDYQKMGVQNKCLRLFTPEN